MCCAKLKSKTVIVACGISPESSCYPIYCAAVQFCLENDKYLKTGNEKILCRQLAERYEDLFDLRKNKEEKLSYYIKKQLTGGMKTSWAFYLRRQKKNIPPLQYRIIYWRTRRIVRHGFVRNSTETGLGKLDQYLRVKWLLHMNIDHISMCQYDILCSLNAGKALSTLEQKYDMSEEDITVLYLWGCMKIFFQLIQMQVQL